MQSGNTIFYIKATNFKVNFERYSNHLKTELVWYSNGRFVSGCQRVLYWNGGLKTGLKKACLRSKISCIQINPVQVFGLKMVTVFRINSITIFVKDGSIYFRRQNSIRNKTEAAKTDTMIQALNLNFFSDNSFWRLSSDSCIIFFRFKAI